MQRCLKSVALRKSFRTFLQEKQCVENLDFYEAVQSYKTITNKEEQQARANEIWNTFVSPTAEREVNIDSGVKKRIQEELMSPKSDLFDAAQDWVYQLMATGAYLNYSLTPMAKMVVAPERTSRTFRSLSRSLALVTDDRGLGLDDDCS